MVAPPPPEIATEFKLCLLQNQPPARGKAKSANRGEAERILKLHRAGWGKLARCYERFLCSIADYRRNISKTQEDFCPRKRAEEAESENDA